jgi:hypothetical protein
MQLQSKLTTTSHPCSPTSQILNHFSLSPFVGNRDHSPQWELPLASTVINTTRSQGGFSSGYCNRFSHRQVIHIHLDMQAGQSNWPTRLCVTHGHNQPNVNVTALLITSRYTLQSRYIDDLLHNKPTLPLTRRPQRVVERTGHKSRGNRRSYHQDPLSVLPIRVSPQIPVPNRHLHRGPE